MLSEMTSQWDNSLFVTYPIGSRVKSLNLNNGYPGELSSRTSLEGLSLHQDRCVKEEKSIYSRVIHMLQRTWLA